MLFASAKEPGAQAARPAPSACGQAKPAGQGVQAAAPPSAKEPAAQRAAASGARPGLAHAKPAGQGVQAEALPRLKAPLGQGSWPPPASGEGQKAPAAQPEHAVWPAKLEKPAAQGAGGSAGLAHATVGRSGAEKGGRSAGAGGCEGKGCG